MIRVRDPDPDFYPSRIPDPWVKMAPDPGSGSATLISPMVSFLYRLLRPPLCCPSRPPACTAPPPSTTQPTQSRGKPRSQRSSVRTGMAARRTVLSRTYWSAPPTRWNHRPICWDRMAVFRRVIIPVAAARVLIPRCLCMSAQCLIGIRTEMIPSRCMTNRLVWIPGLLPCLLDLHRKTCPLRYRCRTSINSLTVTS